MRRSTLVAAGLFLLAEGLFAWGLWQAFASESRRGLDLARAELEVGYRWVVQSSSDLVGAMLRQAVDVPEVRALLREAAGQDAAGRRRPRERLYRLLEPSYRILQAHDLRGLQLVLPDGTSLLRVDRPDRYGDRIAARRPLIARVIETGEPDRAFESSRVHPGVHYVFPLMDATTLVGVVDFGLSFEAIRKALREGALERVAGSQLLIRRDLLETVGEPGTMDLFRPARLNPDFVVEDADSPMGRGPADRPVADWMAQVSRVLAADPGVGEAMRRGSAYGTRVCLGSQGCYIATLMPVPDSLGPPAAIVASYVSDPAYRGRRDCFLVILALGTALILVAGSVSRRWLVSRRRLQTVTESMGEGLYVIDRDGIVVFANPAAVELLGHSKGELLGCNAHRSFHVGCEGASSPGDRCAIRRATEEGTVYRDDNGSFRRLDGELIRVSVVSSPLRQDGEISGSIVLFRDITEEYQARERLKWADVAFRNLAEGVLVTDVEARIIAVNPAFSQITGYSESEVLGRNPRILSSGRHEPGLYEEMWRRISETDAWEGEILNRRKDGRVYPQWLKINTIRDESAERLGYVAVFSDITDLRAKEERLRSLAYQDQLTGLYNRAAFVDLIEHALARCIDRGSRLALLHLDIDRFKRINDNLGHLLGDALLGGLAERLRSCLRARDEAARLGGDEFAILIEDSDRRENVARTARRILSQLRDPVMLDDRPVYLTASMGISVFPEDGTDASTLLRNANAAMSLAKQQGRDGYRFFSAAMAQDVEQRFELESELRQALELGELRLYYQPQVELASGDVIALEALLRWQHPRDGVRGPGAFLGVARDTGLMSRLTEWTFRDACRQCAQWRRMGLPFGRVAFNLDVLSIDPGEIEPLLVSVAKGAGIGPRDIELEIVETAMHPRGAERDLWEGLVTLGFQLAIDDFGTGESSLGRLKRLPVRTLKIDRSFVRDLGHEDNDRSIVRTVIAMAKTLGKSALAEGVETEDQLRFLLDAGCDAVQGYYFSRPLPADEIPALLRSGLLRLKLDEIRTGHSSLADLVGT